MSVKPSTVVVIVVVVEDSSPVRRPPSLVVVEKSHGTVSRTVRSVGFVFQFPPVSDFGSQWTVGERWMMYFSSPDRLSVQPRPPIQALCAVWNGFYEELTWECWGRLGVSRPAD